jgi:uncharacterized protein YwqG
MFLFKIDNVLLIQSVVPQEHTPQDETQPQEWVNLGLTSSTPPVPSSGTVRVAFTLLAGQIPDHTTAAWFLNGAFTYRCSGVPVSGETSFDLHFKQIFIDGFEKAVGYFQPEGKLVVGMEQQEMEHLHRVDVQQELLRILATGYLPEKQRIIQELGAVSYIVQSAVSARQPESRFLGKPQISAGTKAPKDKNGEAMLHLATFKTAEIAAAWPLPYTNWKPYLSFYVALDELQDGWTGNEVDCCVLQYETVKTSRYPERFEYSDEAFITLECKLDLPGKDHPIIAPLQLNTFELEQYELLRETWQTILNPYEAENTKLLGYPDAVQEDVAAELVRMTTNPDNSTATPDNWVLLLQVFTETDHLSVSDQLGYETYYFMIKAADLLSGNFDHVKLVLQNT